MGDEDIYPELTGAIIGAAIEVHRELGPGLLESAYEAALAHELTVRGVAFRRQLRVPVLYKGQPIDVGFTMDLLVAETVVVELKAVDAMNPVFEAQLLTYLRLANKPVGLLINFNVGYLRNGIVRRALTRPPIRP